MVILPVPYTGGSAEWKPMVAQRSRYDSLHNEARAYARMWRNGLPIPDAIEVLSDRVPVKKT